MLEKSGRAIQSNDIYISSHSQTANLNNRVQKTRVKNLYSTDHDFTLTLNFHSVPVGHNSPWSEFIQLNNHNVKFHMNHFNNYDHLYCYVEEVKCDKDNKQVKLLISVKVDNNYDTQRYITRYNTTTRVGMFDSLLAKDVIITASVPQSCGCFKIMYEDETQLDFKLAVMGSLEVTENNSVGFHRFALASCGPVMKNMFNNSWKEKNEGVLELPLELKVIKAFKKYVYTNELPEDKETLLGLVELGSYLMHPKLELDASKRVMELITTDELWEAIEFSVMKKTSHLTKFLLFRLRKATDTDSDHVFDQITKV